MMENQDAQNVRMTFVTNKNVNCQVFNYVHISARKNPYTSIIISSWRFQLLVLSNYFMFFFYL